MKRIKNYPAHLSAVELTEWLRSNVVLDDIAYTCACLLKENGVGEKIILTQEQFDKFFKIRGVREDGRTETRGRKSLKQLREEAEEYARTAQIQVENAKAQADIAKKMYEEVSLKAEEAQADETPKDSE